MVDSRWSMLPVSIYHLPTTIYPVTCYNKHNMPTFLFAALALFVVWLILIFAFPKTRFEQLLMSVVGLLLAPAVILVAANDYRGQALTQGSFIGVEDLLFAFSLFGIAAVIYEVLIGKQLGKRVYKRNEKHEFAVAHWVSWLVIALGIWAFISLSCIYILSLTSIQSLIIGGALIGTYIVADRKNLLVNAIVSGLLTALLVFLSEQLFFVHLFPEAAAQFWQFDRLSGFVIGGIPFEEILWAAVVGFAIGPLYEYVRSLKKV